MNAMHNNHSHNHGHSHTHCYMPASYGRAFIIGIIINTLFIIAEIIYGLKANSLALLADAGHNAGDVLGLFMSLGAILLAKRKPSERFTYGLQSSSIIIALANAVFLLVSIGAIGWEAILRFNKPEITIGTIVISIAAIGIVINGFTAWLFMSGSKHDLNVRGAFIHMLADTLISLGVVISGAIILKSGWLWLDPLVSLTISIIIIIGTWGLLKDALNLALHAVPKGIDPLKVKNYLTSLDGVKDVHDLHIWAMSTTQVALSAHLLMRNGHPGDDFIKNATNELEHNFNIGHSTIQIEIGNSAAECKLAPDNVI